MVAMLLSIPGAAQAGDEAVTYQMNVAHNGQTTLLSGFAPPLVQLWLTNLGGRVSYPVIAEKKVFLTVANTNGIGGTQIYALDLATGQVIWRQLMSGQDPRSNAAYDRGKIFVANAEGLVIGIKASTGRTLWTKLLPDGASFTMPPTAKNGTVFISADFAVFALDEDTGTIKWRREVGSDTSTPALGSDAVYETYFREIYRLDAATGAIRWVDGGGGGGGTTAVLYKNRLYAREGASDGSNAVVGTRTGRLLGTFSGFSTPPAILPMSASSWRVVSLNNEVLSAWDDSGQAAWNFTGDGYLVTAPIVVNGYVIEGSGNGALYVLDGQQGNVVWSMNLASQFLAPPFEWDPNQPMLGLAAGEGVLIVPANDNVYAFVSQ